MVFHEKANLTGDLPFNIITTTLSPTKRNGLIVAN